VTSGYQTYDGQVYSDGTVIDPYYQGTAVDGSIVGSSPAIGSSTITPMAPINP
jgi:hypothetical protein